MRIKVKVKLGDHEYQEFIKGLRNNYHQINVNSFNELVISETIEQFLIHSFEHLLEVGKVRNFTLNAIQAYSIYWLLTNPNSVFTPLQMGNNMKIITLIEKAYHLNLTRRKSGDMLLLG